MTELLFGMSPIHLAALGSIGVGILSSKPFLIFLGCAYFALGFIPNLSLPTSMWMVILLVAIIAIIGGNKK